MASLPPSLSKTLAYFNKYDYPLTFDEVSFWQRRVTPFASSRAKGVTLFDRKREYYFLPGRSHLVALRRQREKFSRAKWDIAKKVGDQLKKFPSIAAIFVTGALAMNNCPANDDIDLMIVTHPNSLWITRFFVNLYLRRLRRFPGQTSAPDKICPNLWLDSNHLSIKHNHSIYIAHEILQAKVLWDRSSIHNQFLTQNSWVKKYLPVAYRENLKIKNLNLIKNLKLKIKNWILWPINFLFFVPQYLYMKPKMTSEKVGLGFAFFHPKTY